jgi:hypothetical protein
MHPPTTLPPALETTLSFVTLVWIIGNCHARDPPSVRQRCVAHGTVHTGRGPPFSWQVTSQSLGLVGAQIYLTMKAVGAKNFVMHFDLATDAGVTIRLSISSMYKVPRRRSCVGTRYASPCTPPNRTYV